MEDDGLCGCGCNQDHLEECYRIRNGVVYFFKVGDWPDLLSHIKTWEETHLNGERIGRSVIWQEGDAQ